MLIHENETGRTQPLCLVRTAKMQKVFQEKSPYLLFCRSDSCFYFHEYPHKSLFFNFKYCTFPISTGVNSIIRISASQLIRLNPSIRYSRFKLFFTVMPSFNAAAIQVRLSWPVASIPVIISNANLLSGTLSCFPA